MSKSGKWIFWGCLVLIILVAAVIAAEWLLRAPSKALDVKQSEVQERIEAYNQPVDENGIAIDMRDNPFF